MDLLIALFTLDPTTITTWPMVAALFIVVGLPTLLTWYGNREVKAIRTSISKNNGGSSVKDALDRIELRQMAAEQRLDTLEASLTAKQKTGVRNRLSKKTKA